MYNSRIIVITGADGSGKTTLVNQLLKHYPTSTKMGIWDSFTENGAKLFQSKEAIDNYLCSLTPIARTFFLTHALQIAIKKLDENNGSLFFIDSYYYKYYCSEIALGTPLKLIKSMTSYFPKPDLTIELHLEIEISATRKSKFSRYECGLVENPNVKDFINFQNKCAKNWTFFREQNWIKINALQNKKTLFNEVKNKINLI